MEGKNEEGRNRGGLGIGASWVFWGEEERKKKLENQKWRKRKREKKRRKKRIKKEKSESKGSRTYRIVTRLSDGVGEQGLGGRKGKKSVKKKNKWEKHPKWEEKKEKRKKEGDKVATCTREDRLGPFRLREICLAR
jgi:hypothetical protein